MGERKHNVIPNEVKLQLTLRSYTDEVRNETICLNRKNSERLCNCGGLIGRILPNVVEIKDEYTPAVYNNPELVEKLQKSFVKILGCGECD